MDERTSSGSCLLRRVSTIPGSVGESRADMTADNWVLTRGYRESVQPGEVSLVSDLLRAVPNVHDLANDR